MNNADTKLSFKQVRETGSRMFHKTIGAVVLGSTVLLSSVACATSYEEAQVLRADPVYRTVSYTVPAERCHDEEVAYYEPERRGSATPTILGAVIGGALGHAVGHDKGNKRIGTAVGAVLGGSIGNDIGRRAQASRTGATRYGTERVCQSVNEVREEEELAGYDVEYAWGNQVYRTHTRNHPGETLRVRVDVAPAE
jgi:uncharacterized protein YcfJ